MSHNAPHMHFADKEAVLAAIDIGQAAQRGQPFQVRLLTAAHPSHLMVMFGPLPTSNYPELMDRMPLDKPLSG
ncbi:MAG: hypothetical protein OHK0023_05350 [Anaerolineae bacterium]